MRGGARATLNGRDIPLAPVKGYAEVSGTFKDGDELRLSFDMPVERLYAHPAVGEDAGRVALRRGPVVYCVEEADIGTEPQRLRLAPDARLEPRYDADLLGGAVVLEGEGYEAAADGFDGGLYRTARPALKPKPFRAIPYHLWANREAGAMQVWLAEK